MVTKMTSKNISEEHLVEMVDEYVKSDGYSMSDSLFEELSKEDQDRFVKLAAKKIAPTVLSRIMCDGVAEWILNR